MAAVPAQNRPEEIGGGATAIDDQDLHNLLRYAHVFASVVRDILEVKLLGEVSADPLSLSQFHLLKLISLNGHHQVGQVADFLGVSAPAASKNIDKLERLGLVSRERSTGDRRATLLASSKKGRNLVARYEVLKESRLAPILESFKPQDLRRLAHLLERFSVALIEAEEAGEGLCFRCSAYFEDSCPVSFIHDNCPYQKVRQSSPATAAGKEA